MTREDIDNIIEVICPNNEDFEKPCISPAYLKNELEALALEQEPCEDEYIKVPKKALKYRTSGMVAYNAEWLKNHFDLERAVICGAQQPCDVAISRQAGIDIIDSWLSCDDYNEAERHIMRAMQSVLYDLPPVIPQLNTGHWIQENSVLICSICDARVARYDKYPYCPNCGAKMVEPQERSDKA